MEIHVNELHHNVIMFCGGICDNNQNMKEKKGVKKGGGGQVRWMQSLNPPSPTNLNSPRCAKIEKQPNFTLLKFKFGIMVEGV